MIATPPGWKRQLHGASVLLVAPAGPAHGAVRYHERLQPLAPARQLLDEHLAGAGLSEAELAGPERLVTWEGEHAVLFTVRGRSEGKPVQRDVGFVIFEDGYARLSGIGFVEDEFAELTRIVRRMLETDTHLLGLRRRRFEFVVPHGWQARARGLQAELYPLDFPRSRGLICVWPAMPVERLGGSAGFLEVVAAEDAAAGWIDLRSPEATPVTAGALSGTAIASTGQRPGEPPITRRLLLFEDDRYLYPMRLETTLPATPGHLDALGTLQGSLQPVPRRGIAVDSVAEQWSE